MERFRAKLIGGILLLVVVTASPAPWNGASPAQDLPVLHATTHLVVVNVLVHDNKGAPVRDLTRKDFTIPDGDKKQNIADFLTQWHGQEHRGHPQGCRLPEDSAGGKLSVSLPFKPENYADELRVVARDAASGLMGSVRIPLPPVPNTM